VALQKLRYRRKDKKVKIHALIKENELEYVHEINKGIENIKTLSDINRIIKSATEILKNKYTKHDQEPIIPAQIKSLINKREKLKSNAINKHEKIELNLICKLIKYKLRAFEETKRKDIIESILQENRSTKKIKKEITLGKYWTTCILNKEGKKITNRIEINRVATEFYSELYSNPNTEISTQTHTQIAHDVEHETEFTMDELCKVVKTLKNNKATGCDKICNEQIKYGGHPLLLKLLNLYNEILYTQQIPKEWSKSDIILIFKSGDRNKIDNYRPITLNTTTGKIFSKLIQARIYPLLDSQQPPEQAGFRKSYSTIEQLHTVNQLIEKGNEYQIGVHLAFIDFRKAFDSIKHNSLLLALKNQGLPPRMINLINKLYNGVQARISTDVMGEYFKIGKGVKQGDPMSSTPFNCLLEEVFRKLEWSDKGVSVNGSYLNNLRFADDIVLL